MTLLQQATELLADSNATLKELNEVYVILKGTTCRTIPKIRYTLSSFVSNPAQFERAIAQHQQDMAEKEEVKHYRFTKAYERAGSPNIILHKPFLQVVKKDQLTDAKASLLAAHPQYSVYVELIEPVKAEGTAPETAEKPVKKAAKPRKTTKKAA